MKAGLRCAPSRLASIPAALSRHSCRGLGKMLVIVFGCFTVFCFYAICVPCVAEKDGDFFMKTLYSSRKYTKYYELGGLL